MSRRVASTIAFIISIWLSGPTDAQTVRYAYTDNCSGPGSGAEADPYCRIQDGVDAAADAEAVLSADGTYTDGTILEGR